MVVVELIKDIGPGFSRRGADLRLWSWGWFNNNIVSDGIRPGQTLSVDTHLASLQFLNLGMDGREVVTVLEEVSQDRHGLVKANLGTGPAILA